MHLKCHEHGVHNVEMILDSTSVKYQVWALADELNAVLGQQLIQPCQQKVSQKNISLEFPGKGRIYIKPARGGYMVALAGNSLVSRMEPFMQRLTGRECHGYYQPGNREPYWYIDDYAQVREAAYFYAGVIVPQNSEEMLGADLEVIAQRPDLGPTEQRVLTQARLGQGVYRKKMLELWDGACAVTGLRTQSALIASHAKSWAKSSDEERLDPHNGLPLTATLDRLFDQYLIAFIPETGEMLISHRVAAADRAILGIPTALRRKLNK